MGRLKIKRLAATLAVATLAVFSANVAWAKAFQHSQSECALTINDHCAIENPNAG